MRSFAFQRSMSLVCLSFFAVAAIAQKTNWPPPELETYGDPPSSIKPSFQSPKGGDIHGMYVSTQVNVSGSGNNVIGDAGNEPSLWVDPTNGNRIAVGWRQFDNVASNFRQAGNAYSTNHGASWTNRPVLESGVFRSDPVLGGDRSGKFYYLSLLQSFYDDIWRSLNGGASYVNYAPALGGDKQWMTIDRSGGVGDGFIYQIWSTAGNNYQGRQFTRSVDGGLTWMNPINMPSQPIWGTLDVGPTGDLYIVGTDANMPSMRFLRSSNAKISAQTPTFDRSVFVDLGGDITYGLPINPGGLGGQAWIAADKSTGPSRGNIYILCSVSGNASNPLDVKMRRSRDGGATWDPVVRINDDPLNGGKYHWFGTLSVAPNGRVDVIWLDTRQSANNSMSALYYSYSIDGGSTFSANQVLSNQFDQSLGYPNQNKMGDYMGMISDNSGADVAYCATFNGEEDIYYMRIPAAPTVLSGTVHLLNWGAGLSGQLATVEIRAVGNTSPLQSSVVALNASGGFNLNVNPGLAPGTYDVTAKAGHWLRKKVGSVSISLAGASGLVFDLANGDCDGDNEVALADYSTLASAFGTAVGDPGFDARADLDGDGEVTLADYGILSVNFGQAGDD